MNIKERQKNSPYFTSGNSGSTFLIAFIFVFLINIAIGDFFSGNVYYKNILSVILSEAIFCAVFLIMCKSANAHKKLIPFAVKKTNPKIYAISAAAIIFLILSMIMFNNIFIKFVESIGYKKAPEVTFVSNWWQFLVAIIVVGVLPAVFEEIIFRGIIYNGLRRHGAVLSVVLTSALFMFLHGGLYQTFYQVMLSVIFIIAIKYTSDIKVPMVMHFLNNVVVLVLDLALGGSAPQTFSALYIVFAILLFIAGIALIVVYGFVLKKLLGGQNAKTAIAPNIAAAESGTELIGSETQIKAASAKNAAIQAKNAARQTSTGEKDNASELAQTAANTNPDVVDDGKMMITLSVAVGICYYILIIILGFTA